MGAQWSTKFVWQFNMAGCMIHDALELKGDPRESNEYIEFSAAISRQWNIPLCGFGPLEK
jgi:hypothetical protein